MTTNVGLCPLLWTDVHYFNAVFSEVHRHRAAAVYLYLRSLHDFALTHTCPLAAVW